MILGIGIAMLGILIAIPLLAMWRTRPPNVWLGLFVFAQSLLVFSDVYIRNPAIFGLFDWPLAGLGTFYYFYVRGVIGLRNRPIHVLHFVPFLLFVGFLIWIRINVPGWTRIQPGPLSRVFLISVVVAQALCLAYILMVYRLLYLHRRHVRACFSSIAQRDLHWLTWLTSILISNFFLWAMALQRPGLWGWALHVGQLAMLYFIGWYGTRQVDIFRGQEHSLPVETESPTLTPVAPSELPSIPVPETAANKYARSGMTDAAKELIGERLLSRMNQSNDFLENDITLADLAARIGTSPHLVSQYLNHELEVNFFDYINGFRVAAVEKRLQDPDTKGITLVEIALACGFNSKSTFNAAFKRVHGVAPSVWRSQQAGISAQAG